ncbi:cell division protein FtsQ/DivIB [Arundinibacter roseus]|uniref:Cell division protein FtsQ/DivIB C-terminal domain-containing protein n=1 Tax=Arundinibacter roseus TaxID=2070510 RepID=A0A4V2X9G9_9BACT|nr:cell division protein FtsQ/DivIB [Arundinibacter roseus]TDB63685.1 hypothetical protein EZE20_15420 [Arundinibacter roseus]
MLRKFDYKSKLFGMSIWILVLTICVGMAENKLRHQQINDVIVKVDYESGIRFVTKSDVEKLITNNGNDPIHGNRQKNIPLSALENRIKLNKHIKSGQIFHDLEGNLVVQVEQEKPVARWINNSRNGEWRKSEGFYINELGKYFPLSERYSAHVLLVSGTFFSEKKNLTTKYEKDVLELIKALNQDPLWNVQITQMDVSKDGEIDLFTTIGNQRIEFGKAENIDSKLGKLRTFYEKVMASDWSRYSKISLKFSNQIVCE